MERRKRRDKERKGRQENKDKTYKNRVRKRKIMVRHTIQYRLWLTQFDMYWLITDPNWKKIFGNNYSNLIYHFIQTLLCYI